MILSFLKSKRFCLLRLALNEQSIDALKKILHFMVGNVDKFGFALLSVFPSVIEHAIVYGKRTGWAQYTALIETAFAEYTSPLR